MTHRVHRFKMILTREWAELPVIHRSIRNFLRQRVRCDKVSVLILIFWSVILSCFSKGHKIQP